MGKQLNRLFRYRFQWCKDFQKQRHQCQTSNHTDYDRDKNGFRTCPPRPLHPLDEFVERKFAHSLRFVFPNSTAPASRNFFTINASLSTTFPSSPSDPAVVCILSPRINIIFNHHRNSVQRTANFSVLAFLIQFLAISNASGFSSITAFKCGSTSAIRSRYFLQILSAVSSPASIFAEVLRPMFHLNQRPPD